MPFVTLQDQNALAFIDQTALAGIESKVKSVHDQLHQKTGLGNDYLGWLDYPTAYDKDEFAKILESAKLIQSHSDILVVIGVGGSYLGARATIELLNHQFQNELPKNQRKVPKIIFTGHHLSGSYSKDLLDLLKHYDFSINVISKSGSTFETAISFRILRDYMKERYNEEEMKKRIFVTTDKKHGALKELADREGYQTFTIPNDIGGRYSVLTAVGLLPIAVSGISIQELMEGAQLAQLELNDDRFESNPSYRYAALRQILYTSGKKIEILSAYEPRWHYFQEWWKQLFGESEGKNGKGLFPSTALYSTDLHSIGQYIQDGERHFFQTILFAEQVTNDLTIPFDDNNLDRLNYLSGKSLQYLNKNAFEGALLAHTSGNVPNMVLKIPNITAFSVGYLLYFFQKACAVSSYILGVNPFDQPGVENYKQNMIFLLKNE